MEKETFGSLFNDAKVHAQTWVETRATVYKLKAIRIFSKVVGNFAWLNVSLFLFFLFAVFVGLTAGFWLSSYLGSYAAGFGVVALLILLKITLLAIFRKRLFINPVIRKTIRECCNDTNQEKENHTN